jgi:hypothetical protein
MIANFKIRLQASYTGAPDIGAIQERREVEYAHG